MLWAPGQLCSKIEKNIIEGQKWEARIAKALKIDFIIKFQMQQVSSLKKSGHTFQLALPDAQSRVEASLLSLERTYTSCLQSYLISIG